MRIAKPKLGQVGDYWLSKKPGREREIDPWCRTWYDKQSRQTRRVSLGTADIREASKAIAKWAIFNDRPQKAQPQDVLIETVLLTYWEDHAKKIPSFRAQRAGLDRWQEFWSGMTVGEITPDQQRLFTTHLSDLGMKASTIDRVLSVGQAALNRAVKWQMLDRSPHIFFVESVEQKRSREPLGRPIGPTELAKLLDATCHRHLFMFILLAANTLARPGAILDLRRIQCDLLNGVLAINPPGRTQTKKRRPTVPITPTLRTWLEAENQADAFLVSYNGNRIRDIKGTWCSARRAAGLDARVTPYSIRHGIARELRKRKVPKEQISLFLGHLDNGPGSTTDIYAPFEPEYCAEAVAALEDVMAEVRNCLKTRSLDDPYAVISAPEGASSWEKRLSPSQTKQLEAIILEGRAVKKIARMFGISTTSVYKHRRRLNGTND